MHACSSLNDGYRLEEETFLILEMTFLANASSCSEYTPESNAWRTLSHTTRLSTLFDTTLHFITPTSAHQFEWRTESYFVEKSRAVADGDVLARAQSFYLVEVEGERNVGGDVKGYGGTSFACKGRN
mmetsp:Transcript_42256/g.42830  ORF Transcript_42256/g.42830 Transcript_42256/m.42830 type:complete len:127 (-) Transcript_42256:545-925(-)